MGKPFIKLVQSPHAYYFFDVNQNQVVRIPEQTYHILEEMLSGKDTKEDENIRRLKRIGFLSDRKVCEIRHPDTDMLQDILGTKLNSLVLQITQSCNLRCRYCIYSEHSNQLQRSHSMKRMDLETAKKAVDFFAVHSCETQLPTVAFYGGEPLLEFENIKRIITYAKEKLCGQKIRFTFTTNGVLLTPEIADYAYENEIYFMLSLDGPASVHDKNRKDAGGNGTYEVIQKNMSYIKERYPEYYKKLAMNTVLDTGQDYEKIVSMYQNPLWSGMSGYYSSYIEEMEEMEEMKEMDEVKHPVITDDFRKQEAYHRFLAYAEYLKTGAYTGKDAVAAQDVRELGKLKDETFEKHQGLPERGAPSGPCVPGQLKLFVNADGDFYPCERVSELSECMKIGNVVDGFDASAVEQMLNIATLTEDNCRTCWAFRLCGLCVRQADGGTYLSKEARLAGCKKARIRAEQKIRDYIMVKECGRGL